jgi:hypothetical protein
MMPPLWKCPRRVGFLFSHPCTRTTAVGCPDCQNGQIDDPYRRRDRYSYDDYDYYDDSLTGYALSSLADRMDPGFTEADGESLVTPDDGTGGFEDDLSGS